MHVVMSCCCNNFNALNSSSIHLFSQNYTDGTKGARHKTYLVYTHACKNKHVYTNSLDEQS